MTRLITLAVLSILAAGVAGRATATPVSEATVEKVCGDKIEGGCSGDMCSTGCTVNENGKTVDYSCKFPNKPGKTKAKCAKFDMSRTAPGATNNAIVGGNRPVLNGN